MRHIRTLFTFLVFIILSSTPIVQAAPEQRTALVIGNSNYSSGPLRNPVNDATDIAATLQRLGFSVIIKKNASQRVMEESIQEFGNKLKRGGVGLFYYAGHGLQVNGVNYLIPIGAKIHQESDVKYEAIDANKVLDEMANANNGFNIVILDACRDNPLTRSFRSATRGLAIVSSAPVGTFISYSTGPGQVAADGDGRNSPFTEALIQNLQESGRTIEQVFKGVRQRLGKQTGGRQIPWELSSLQGEFYFKPADEKQSVQTSPSPLTTASLPPDKPMEMQETGAKYFPMLATRGMNESLTYFEKAIKDNPGAIDERAGLAIGLLFKEKKEEAKYHIQRLKDEGQMTPYTRLALGLYQGSEKNYEDAMYQINRAREEGVDANLARLVMAWTYRQNGKREQADRMLAEYNASVPKSEAINTGLLFKRFIAYDNGTVLDTQTNLMWAAKDNGSPIDWHGAKSYCENYRGGGYTDWRMPTQNELAELYDRRGYHKNAIKMTTQWIWASETRGSEASYIVLYGNRQPSWNNQTYSGLGRALPVRSGK